MDDINTVFRRDLSEYDLNMVPTKNYVKQMSKYISKITNKDIKTSKKILSKLIANSNKKDPEVTYRHRENNGDRAMQKTTLTEYINNAIDDNNIIAPSFTILDHPDKKKSLHSEFLSTNIKLRKQDKANMFKYKQLGDDDKYNYYDVLQKVRKIFNNSLSGAYASPSTILYHPAAHSVLTSMTRSVASIGNAITESMIGGNKLLRTPEITMNYIIAIVSEVDTAKLTRVMNKFKLYYPTVDEVYDMLLYSFKNYWRDSAKEEDIKNFLSTLEPCELASVLYVNDLYNLKKYNEDFVRKMLDRLSARVEYDNIEPLLVLKKANGGVLNLVHHICMEDILGKKIDYNELAKDDPNLLMLLGATANNVIKVMYMYKDLFRMFYTTDILPPNVANIKEMIRDVIVLSDTDSTCGSYDKWVEWYFGNVKYSSKAVGLAAAVMTINTQVMDHNIKIFAKNMNAENKLIGLLEMKNEFFWSAFITANVSKHYYADVRVREGNVYDKPDLELKGVHLIASAISPDVRDRAYDMIKDINYKLANNIPIYPEEMIDRVLEVEELVVNKIRSGDVNIFKAEKIKPLASYKIEDPGKNNYFHHILWDKVFKDTYGNPGDPEYRVLKINTTLNNKLKLNEYIDSLEPKMGEAMREVINKYGKKALEIMRVPVSIAGGKGIPKEILDVVDTYKVVNDNLNIFYIILESIGIYNKPKKILSDTYDRELLKN